VQIELNNLKFTPRGKALLIVPIAAVWCASGQTLQVAVPPILWAVCLKLVVRIPHPCGLRVLPLLSQVTILDNHGIILYCIVPVI